MSTSENTTNVFKSMHIDFKTISDSSKHVCLHRGLHLCKAVRLVTEPAQEHIAVRCAELEACIDHVGQHRRELRQHNGLLMHCMDDGVQRFQVRLSFREGALDLVRGCCLCSCGFDRELLDRLLQRLHAPNVCDLCLLEVAFGLWAARVLLI